LSAPFTDNPAAKYEFHILKPDMFTQSWRTLTT
jgi:hypothetical protein